MKKIKDYFPEVYDKYFLSENGILYTDYGTKEMSDNAIQNGYIVNSLYGENGYRKDYKRHYLVATLFCKKDNDDNQINHIDGNKLNNAYENLEWCTSKENIQHAWKNGLSKARKGSKNNWAVLTENSVFEIAKLLEEKKYSGRYIANLYNVSP